MVSKNMEAREKIEMTDIEGKISIQAKLCRTRSVNNIWGLKGGKIKWL